MADREYVRWCTKMFVFYDLKLSRYVLEQKISEKFATSVRNVLSCTVDDIF